jgi:modulator of FtsH protease
MPSFTTGWENFFVAEVGAAAALSGLLFVAVSINLARILAIPHLPERAGETLLLLLGVLAVATFGLIPGQTARALGLEVLGAGALAWMHTVRMQLRAYRDAEARQWLAGRVAGTQLATLPFVVSGALLATGHASGLYWMVPGVLASFGASILNAWVLLVEILR